MKRISIVVLGLSLLTAIAALAFWTWDIPAVENAPRVAMTVSSTPVTKEIPAKNQLIIEYTEEHGREIAPEYYPVVCTEFLIQVINHFTPISKQTKRDIRIITDEDLSDLVHSEADIIKGVQVAMTRSRIGDAIEVKDVVPGDFVQFWDTELSLAWGHCGIVHQVVPGEFISVYSSHPITSGYGIQRFPWPEKVFFARLK